MNLSEFADLPPAARFVQNGIFPCKIHSSFFSAVC